MSRIEIPTYESLNAEARAAYDGQIKAHGRITNMKKTLLHSVPAFHVLMEWYPLRDALLKFLTPFQTDVFAFSISAENECLICSTFFRKIIKDNGRDPDALVLDETETLLSAYGRACVQKPTAVPDALFAKLKARFSEEEIVLLTAFAGMMIATNLINNALEVPLDDYLESYTKK